MNKFCIIGLGSHAIKKIYPSLIGKKNIIFTVTRHKKNKIKGIRNYKNIYSAFSKLGQDCIYIISTPPSKHFKFINYLINKKVNNVYIEKPIVIDRDHFDKIMKNTKNNLIEIYPYKTTKLYKEFKKICNGNKNNIKKIQINFFIPSYPANSFRFKQGIENSSLYDIGCYPIDLLYNLNINLGNFTISRINANSSTNEYFEVKFKYKYEIICNFGLKSNYKNNLIILMKNNRRVCFDKFFYAQRALKYIKFYYKNKLLNKKSINDINGFESYFNMHNKLSNSQKIKLLNFSYSAITKLNQMSKHLQNNKIL